MATVLLAIMIAAVLVAIGTPIAAIWIYRNRRNLFPDLRDQELKLKQEPQERQEPS